MGRLLLLLLVSSLYSAETIYLSWYGDPTTTMTIQWHAPENSNELQLQTADGAWHTFEANLNPLTGEETFVHAVQLEQLDPDTTYSFKLDGKTYSFWTAPTTLAAPVRFLIGGDLYESPKLFRKMCQTAAQLDPLFAVLGGDLAYAIKTGPLHFSSAASKWRSFLADWSRLMVAENNRLIPFLVVSGNHDIAPDDYKLFFELFAFPEKQLYRSVDFGSYLSLTLLDTGHFQPIDGRQTLWLEQTLSAHAQTPYLFAIYHVAAYPSFYPYQGRQPTQIRTHWCPLFDRSQISAAFEHHNHTFKKTFRLKANQINPDGTLYFGDGCWGAHPRKTIPIPYLQERGRKNHLYLLELTPKSVSVSAIGITGDLLDQTTLSPRN
jgi:hypothetical protein